MLKIITLRAFASAAYNFRNDNILTNTDTFIMNEEHLDF